MKKIPLLIASIALLFFSACTKEETIVTKDTFVVNLTTDSDYFAVGSVQLDEGNYLIATADQLLWGLARKPGHMVKMDNTGKIIWDKRIPEQNLSLWRVIAIPGTGYATLGYRAVEDAFISLCIFDNDGNLLSIKRINLNGVINWNAQYNIIRLSNGNFAVAGGDESNYNIGYLKIFDADFNLIHSKIFFSPAGYDNVSFYGLCQQSNGNIAAMAATANLNNSQQNNLLLVRTASDGSMLTYTFLEDLNYYETANALATCDGGMVAVTSGIQYGSHQGTYVNYMHNYNDLGQYISGKINLVRYDDSGNYKERKEISGYPGNGMINTMRHTTDGGFILCGTVGQANSAVIVSYTKIFLVKLDANLDVQWQKIINATYPAYGVDALPVSNGGYLVSATVKSLNDHYEVTVIKTDVDGNF